MGETSIHAGNNGHAVLPYVIMKGNIWGWGGCSMHYCLLLADENIAVVEKGMKENKGTLQR